MFTRTVDAIVNLHGIQRLDNVIRSQSGDRIKVKRDHIAPGHVIGLAPSTVQGTGHKTAHVL